MEEFVNGLKPSKPNPEKAVFILWVCFKDKKKRLFYSYHTSYDATLKKVIVNDLNALNKLKNLIEFKWANLYKTACIYHKKTNTQLYKWVDNKLIQNAPYKINYENNCVKIIPL